MNGRFGRTLERLGIYEVQDVAMLLAVCMSSLVEVQMPTIDDMLISSSAAEETTTNASNSEYSNTSWPRSSAKKFKILSCSALGSTLFCA